MRGHTLAVKWKEELNFLILQYNSDFTSLAQDLNMSVSGVRKLIRRYQSKGTHPQLQTRKTIIRVAQNLRRANKGK